jgi:hypothetical protein
MHDNVMTIRLELDNFSVNNLHGLIMLTKSQVKGVMEWYADQ